jgi:phosphatidylethanolamine-binding protein (PEBP) family uncharacterized protein
MALTLNSPAFKQNGHIPSKYTCEGEDISPPLALEGVPNGTKSLVLIIDDPDAPEATRTGVQRQGRQKWHQVQINLSCPKYTGGCTATACDGLPSHHRFFSPQTEPEAPVPPRLRGFSYANIYRSALITE